MCEGTEGELFSRANWRASSKGKETCFDTLFC